MTTVLTARDIATAARRAILEGAIECDRYHSLYPIPRGGIPVAYALQGAWPKRIPIATGEMLSSYEGGKVLVVDDVYDSGKTVLPYREQGHDVFCLYSKKDMQDVCDGILIGQSLPNEWVVFPWEGETMTSGPEDAVRRLLQYLGRDPDDPHLVDTPRRMLGWLKEFQEREDFDFSTTTFDGVEYGGMVLVRDITFTSLCEHHLLPFAGKAAVAYIPNMTTHKVIGLSKLARFVLHYAKRPQVQERMTEQIMREVKLATNAESVAVLIQAEHMCMSFRGPNVPGHTTTTSSACGAFLEQTATREEFMSLALTRR